MKGLIAIFFMFNSAYAQQNMFFNNNVMPVDTVPGTTCGTITDTDALAFFLATGITDTTQKCAINQLVIDLKAASIWTKMDAIYPMAGGTQQSCKYNLKDTATYKITYSNTSNTTTSSLGISFVSSANGSTGFNTFSNTSNHVSVYTRTTTAIAGCAIGNTNASAANGVGIYPRFSGTTTYWNTDAGATKSFTSTTDGSGFWIASRTASNATALYRNGSSIQTATTASGTMSIVTVRIGVDGASANPYTSGVISFASIGTGLDATESANFYTAVQAFQTTLSRQL